MLKVWLQWAPTFTSSFFYMFLLAVSETHCNLATPCTHQSDVLIATTQHTQPNLHFVTNSGAWLFFFNLRLRILNNTCLVIEIKIFPIWDYHVLTSDLKWLTCQVMNATCQKLTVIGWAAINTQRCECCVVTPHCVISYSQQYYIQRRSTQWTELFGRTATTFTATTITTTIT